MIFISSPYLSLGHLIQVIEFVKHFVFLHNFKVIVIVITFQTSLVGDPQLSPHILSLSPPIVLVSENIVIVARNRKTLTFKINKEVIYA